MMAEEKQMRRAGCACRGVRRPTGEIDCTHPCEEHRGPRVGDRVRVGRGMRRARMSEIGKFVINELDGLEGEGEILSEDCADGGRPTFHVLLDGGRLVAVRTYRCRRVKT